MAGDWWNKVWPFRHDSRRLQADGDCPCRVTEQDLRDNYGAKFATEEDAQKQQPAARRRASQEEPPSVMASLGAGRATLFAGLTATLALTGLLGSFGLCRRALRTKLRQRADGGPYTELAAKERSHDLASSSGNTDEMPEGSESLAPTAHE
jgi:hypothetical protein